MCLDGSNKVIKVAELKELSQKKAIDSGKRFAKLMNLRFHLAKLEKQIKDDN
tara:strand:- start:4136 stop:4291 length:156 start_codon:yes stop_codon:yes gene_type:complete